jgi:hypothetical protein
MLSNDGVHIECGLCIGNHDGNFVLGRLYKGLDRLGKILFCLLLSAFTFSASLVLFAGAVMARVKNTAVPVDPEDSVKLETAEPSVRDDVAEASSASDQDTGDGAPLGGFEDCESMKMMTMWMTVKPPMMKMLILRSRPGEKLLQLLVILSILVLRL